MKFLCAAPRLPRALAGSPLFEPLPSGRCDPRTLHRIEGCALVRDAEQRSEQEIWGLVVKAGYCYQSAKNGEVMDSESLLVAMSVRRHNSPSENRLERGSNF